MNRNSFPYQPKKLPPRPKPTVPLRNKGCEIQTNPNGWISDGPLRDIEKGLPIPDTLPPALDPNKKSPMDNFVSVLVDRPYMKSLKKMYGGLIDKHPELDFDDPNNLSSYEKQFIADNSHEEAQKIMKATTLKLSVPDQNGITQTKVYSTVPLNAHLYTFGGAIPYYDSQIFKDDEQTAKVETKEVHRRRTGIYGPKDKNQKDASSLLRELHYSSLSKQEIENELKNKDDATKPVDISVPKRARAHTSFLKIAQQEENTLKDCLHTYFNPSGKPFVPIGVEHYFPLSLLECEKKVKSTTDSSTIELGDIANETQRAFASHPSEEMDPRSKLIDTSDEDVLFTKDKTLFKRSEIASMRAFTKHWDRETAKQEGRLSKVLKERNKMVEKAFQSREVMQTYLKLLDEDCERISSGLVGKSPYKHKSMWQVALEQAPKDPASLGVRREYWWRYAAFVREIGGIHDDYDNEVTQCLRNYLMDNHPVEKSLFFDVLAHIRDDCFSVVSSLKVIEFMRISFDIEQKEFQSVFEERHISQLIYSQTILTNMPTEQLEAMNRISKMKITVPDVHDIV